MVELCNKVMRISVLSYSTSGYIILSDSVNKIQLQITVNKLNELLVGLGNLKKNYRVKQSQIFAMFQSEIDCHKKVVSLQDVT